MRLGIFISELVKVLEGRSLDELSFSGVRDAVERSVRFMRYLGLRCGEFLVGLDGLEKVVKVISGIDGFDFLLHEVGEYGGNKLSLMDEEERKRVVEGIKSVIDYASDGGIRVLTIHPANFNPGKTGYAYSDILSNFFGFRDAWRVSVELLRYFSNYAGRRGVVLGLENMPVAVCYRDCVLKCPHLGVVRNEFFKIVSEVDSLSLKVTFDVGHANTVVQPCDYIRGNVGLVTHIHLHDNDGRYDQHAPLGTGTVNLYFLFKVLRKEEYDESIVIERIVDEALFNDLRILKHYAK